MYTTKALVSIGAYVPPMPGEMSDLLRQKMAGSGYASSLLPMLSSYTIATHVLKNNEAIRNFIAPGYKLDDKAQADFPLWMLDSYLGMVSSSLVDNTTMLRISSFAKNPKITSEVANAHAAAFIEIVKNERRVAAAVNEKFIRSKVDEAKADAEEKRKKFETFVQEHSMQGVLNTELPANLNAERFHNLVTGIAQSAQERATLEGELRQLQNDDNPRNPRLTAGSETAYLRLIALQSEFDIIKKANPYSDTIPQMKAEMAGLRKVVKESAERDLAQRRLMVKASRERERLFMQELEELKKSEAKEAEDRINYMLVKQEKEAADEALAAASKRLDDTIVNIENDQSTVRMIDFAVTPEWPISPNTRSNLTAGLFAGVVFGIALAFLLDFMNNAICSVTELQRATRCMIIGIVPIFSRRKKKKDAEQTAGKDEPQPSVTVKPVSKEGGLAGTVEQAQRAKESIEKLKAAATVRPGQTSTQDRKLLKAGLSAADFDKLSKAKNVHNIVCIKEPLSQEAESFRNIRTTLRHAGEQGGAQVVLVTSGRKGDGKTTIAANLAASMAQASARTLLIDADLRLPNVHKYFGCNREDIGLVDYLTGDVEVGDIVRATEIPNLSVVLAGSPTPIPAELLETALMSDLLEAMKKEYDHIIIDSPPIAHVTDPLLLASQVSGVLLVARSGITPTPVVEYAVQRLHQMKATIFGCVLNGVCRTNSYREAEYYFVANKYQ